MCQETLFPFNWLRAILVQRQDVYPSFVLMHQALVAFLAFLCRFPVAAAVAAVLSSGGSAAVAPRSCAHAAAAAMRTSQPQRQENRPPAGTRDVGPVRSRGGMWGGGDPGPAGALPAPASAGNPHELPQSAKLP